MPTNVERRIAGLQRRIEKDHDYRVRIWAQTEIRIQGRIAELEKIGGSAPTLFEPDFTDQLMLLDYAAQKDENAALSTG
jgi:hypothetical protein